MKGKENVLRMTFVAYSILLRYLEKQSETALTKSENLLARIE